MTWMARNFGRRNLGEVKIGASLGEGCSPVLHKDKLVILRDNRGQSTIQVLNAKNGETIWMKNRKHPERLGNACSR